MTTSRILINDETLAISKITNLTSVLGGIQNNLSNIQSNDTDIAILQSENVTHEGKLQYFKPIQLFTV